MKITYLLIAVFGLLLSSHANSQDFIHRGEKSTLADKQAAWQAWASTQDLDHTKGWKWYARWLEEQLQRSSSSGQWPDQSELLSAALDVAEKKTQSASRTNAAWVPVGPAVFPYIPGGSLIQGMGRINTVTFHPTDANTLWVGVAQGGIWKSTNGGHSWRPLTDQLPILRISDIAVDRFFPDTMYISVGDYAYLGSALDTDSRKRNTHYGLGVYKSIDGGETWNPTGLTFNQTSRDASLIRRVFISSTLAVPRVLAAGIQGVFLSTDGGDNWIKTLDEVISDIEQDPVHENILYASSHNVAELGIGRPAIWKSEDFGQSWIELNIGITSNNAQRIELAIAPSNPDYIYALVCDRSGGLFGFYRSVNGGQNWLQRSTTPNILHWYAGTSPGGQGGYDLAIMVNRNNENIVYTGGVNMWGTEDGGMTWKRASFWLPDYGPSLHADHHFYKYNPLDQYYYACHDGGINRTQKINLFDPDTLNSPGFDFGTNWEDISDGMEITSFYRMDISRVHRGDVIAGSQDNSTFIKRDTQWINTVLGDGMDCIFHPTNENIVYASTQGGRFTRSNDGGYTFGPTLTNDIRSTETGAWTTPFEQDPQNPDGLYAAFGNVWQSTNRGNNWTQLTDLPSIPGSDFILPASTFSIAPSNANRFYVAKRNYPALGLNSQLWTTPDGGTTVENIIDGLPDSLFISASAVSDINSELVWVVFSGFADGLKVFRSDDAGQNWNNISNNLPNIPVNAIEFVPGSINNTIYIGTDVGIYFTNDDLSEWILYSDELPNVIVTDLVIDTEHEEIYASTFGRGIWRSDLAEFTSTGEIKTVEYDVSIAPNPNTGNFTVRAENLEAGNYSLELIDVKGRVNHRQQMDISESSWSSTIQLDLSSGLYYLRLTNGRSSNVSRLVIDK